MKYLCQITDHFMQSTTYYAFAEDYDCTHLIENIKRIKDFIITDEDIALTKKKLLYIIIDIVRIYNKNLSISPLHRIELRTIILSMFSCLVTMSLQSIHITLNNLIFEISLINFTRSEEMFRSISQCLPSNVIADAIGVSS